MNRLLLLFVVLGLFLLTTGAVASDTIRVGVSLDQGSVRVGSSGDFVIRTSAGVIVSRSAQQTKVLAEQGRLMIGQFQFDPPAYVESESGFVLVNDRTYRGIIELTVSGGTVSAINVLPLDQYLYGVVPREMSPNWSHEALKAQSIAARTFALFQSTGGKHRGFDVCGTVCCQVYGGVDAERVSTNAAVDATSGIVMRYNGNLVQAFYHASSGGHTENLENVWTGYLPYLRGVPDVDHGSPHAYWEETMTMREIENRLINGGIDVGQIYDIAIVGDRGVSGRAIDVKITGSYGEQVVRATRLRPILGLKSTLFEIDFQTPQAREVSVQRASQQQVAVMGADENTYKVLGSTIAVDADGVRYRMADATISGWQKVAGSVVITGRGWGHGVGMSQWGASELAMRGHDYAYILRYYYQGVDIESW